MNLTCTIPCIPYLAKFLFWKERLEPGETVDLNYAMGDTGFVLAGVLVKKLDAEFIYNDEELTDDYTFEVKFLISPRKFNYGRIFISEEGVKYFNSYLRKNLHEMLMDRILQGRKHNIKEKDTIYGFMHELAIEDDVSYDALKKAQSRLRNRKKIPPFRQHNRTKVA